METPASYDAGNMGAPAPERPEFLKILCILSFVACGLMILFYSIGTMCLALSEEVVTSTWDKIVESNPALAEVDPMLFFHQVGMLSLYCLIANIFSLVGVIMMWRLEKIGFFIYAIAELATNFFSLDVDMGQESSPVGTIVMVVLDLVFIVMYFLNLKHMNRGKNHDIRSEITGV